MKARPNTDDVQEKINDLIWSTYAKDTAAFSSICRQIAFAEGGICWALLAQRNATASPEDIKMILAVISVFFILDAAQYFFGAIIYYCTGRYYERRHKGKKLTTLQVKKYSFMNLPSRSLWVIKTITIGYASHLILQILLN